MLFCPTSHQLYATNNAHTNPCRHHVLLQHKTKTTFEQKIGQDLNECFCNILALITLIYNCKRVFSGGNFIALDKIKINSQ